MSEAKHTPGPWKPRQMVAPGRAWDGQWEVHWNDDGECVAEIVFREADARLIAAAPDLLAACKWFLAPDHPIGSDPELIRKAKERFRAAIAKATETPS